MRTSELLVETFDRLPDLVREAVDGLSPQQLRWTPAPGANPIGWLVWHLTRIQDDHLAEVRGEPQVWTGGGWAKRFGLDRAEPADTGYGHTAAQVAAIAPESAAALVDYHTAVAERTRRFLHGLTDTDLDRVVDDSWDPPVTLGVRLVSVANDDLQHVGQASYLRGLLGDGTG
ncbi:mycothiol transferase [Solwaraspora sp. WMMA2101]|uniref:mycothiol transferase n=1 Tax=Solwaraspora sp. WMMA2101 TaxID=3404124 RepID=UPI003B93185F